MPISGADQALDRLIVIMQRHGVRCTPAEFHAAVNVTFHEFESEVYDQEHADMWASLPREFARLTDSVVVKDIGCSRPLNLLDIGCGTGLATQCLLETSLGEHIHSVDLLDTSPSMLKHAAKRAAGWNRPFVCHQGLLGSLPADKKYSVIVVCSVLHHVPDLEGLLKQVRDHQAEHGLFIHLQDLNGDYYNDPELRQRREQLAGKRRFPGLFYRMAPRRVLARLCRELTGTQNDTYWSKTNRSLIAAGVIRTPLSIHELYSITDIHLYEGQGISFEQLREWLPGYECLSHRSYGFFGKLWSDLPPNLQLKEEQLSRDNNLSGSYVAGAWRLST